MRYKGIEYEISYRGYKIGSPVNIEFQPYFGNRVLDLPVDDAERLIKRRVRAEINRYLNEVKTNAK